MESKVTAPMISKIFEYLTSLPGGTEVTTYEVAERVLGREYCEMHFLFDLDYEIRKRAKKYKLILDSSKYDGLITGLPYNIGYIIKKQLICNKRVNKKDMVTQMVEGIIGEEPDKNATPKDVEKYENAKKRLSGRALEYLMFSDED